MLYFSIYLLWPMLVFKVKMQNVSFINILYQYTKKTWNIRSVSYVVVDVIKLALDKLIERRKKKWATKYLANICMFQRKFIKVPKKIYFVLCVIQMRGTQRGRWDKKRWRRRERKETSVLCSGGKQKWATTSSSNTFCNLRQMHFAIWDKCILQFETNMYSPVETGKVTFWCFSPRELFGFFFNLGSFTVPLLEVAFSTRGVHRAHIIWVFVLSK